MLAQPLLDLGLTDKEASVYLEVMRRGKTTPPVVSKATGINRATVYSVAKTLLEKSIIAGDLSRRPLYLTALPPEELRTMVEKEKRAVAAKAAAVDKAVKELSAVSRATPYAIPKIQVIDESNLRNYLFKNIEKWNRSAAQYDGTHWGFQDHTFAEKFQDWLDEFWRLSQEGIKVRLISNRAQIERHLRKKKYRDRLVLPWKMELQFTATIWVVGDFLVLIYTSEKPFYAVELFNPIFAENLRAFFQNFWKEVMSEAAAKEPTDEQP